MTETTTTLCTTCKYIQILYNVKDDIRALLLLLLLPLFVQFCTCNVYLVAVFCFFFHKPVNVKGFKESTSSEEATHFPNVLNSR